jgi:hypothetical protein
MLATSLFSTRGVFQAQYDILKFLNGTKHSNHSTLCHHSKTKLQYFSSLTSGLLKKFNLKGKVFQVFIHFKFMAKN